MRRQDNGQLRREMSDALFQAGVISVRPRSISTADPPLELPTSPVSINFEALRGHSKAARMAARCIEALIADSEMKFDRVVENGQSSSLCKLSEQLKIPHTILRDAHDTALIDEICGRAECIAVVDCQVTDGHDQVELLQTLSAASLEVGPVFALLDHEQGASEWLAQHGFLLHSFFTLEELLAFGVLLDHITTADQDEARNFLRSR